MQLLRCSRCTGFLALAVRTCPHCDAPAPRARQALLGLAAIAGGSAVSMTLMACYGAACVNDTCRSPDDASPDAGHRVSDPSVADGGTDGG